LKFENCFFNYSYYLFDLDNTIYNEKFYLFKCYKKISEFLETEKNIPQSESLRFLINTFISEGRESLFDKLFNKFSIENHYLNDLLSILRQIQFGTKIKMFLITKQMINKLAENNKELFIVTNGNLLQQKNKISQIDWEGMLHYFEIIYADEICPKPSIHLFDHIRKKYNVVTESSLIIGDSEFDFMFAKNSKTDFLKFPELKLIKTNYY